MNKGVVVLAVAFGCAQSALAGMCSPGTLQSYIALGAAGCTAGPDQFSSFQTLTGFSPNVISPNAVTVTPLISGANVSLAFSTNLSAATNSTTELFFNYLLKGNVIGSMITLANTSATGDGVATYIQNLCNGGTFGSDGISGCTGTAYQLAVTNNDTDQAAFAPASAISVTDDFTLDGGQMGSATGGTFTDRFSNSSGPGTATPEPNTIIVSGVGMVSLIWLRRRSLVSFYQKTKESL